jgi:hypothetical protein
MMDLRDDAGERNRAPCISRYSRLPLQAAKGPVQKDHGSRGLYAAAGANPIGLHFIAPQPGKGKVAKVMNL